MVDGNRTLAKELQYTRNRPNAISKTQGFEDSLEDFLRSENLIKPENITELEKLRAFLYGQPDSAIIKYLATHTPTDALLLLHTRDSPIETIKARLGDAETLEAINVLAAKFPDMEITENTIDRLGQKKNKSWQAESTEDRWQSKFALPDKTSRSGRLLKGCRGRHNG